MRIALITTSYPAFPGDPSGHFVETEARQLARNAEVVVLTAGQNKAAQPVTLERGGIAVFRSCGGDAFGWPGVAPRIQERPWRLASVALWIHKTQSLLRGLPAFDRVVAHWAVPCAFPIARPHPRTRGFGVPLEVVSHGGDVRALTRLPFPLRHAIVERILCDAERWRFVSEALHDELAVTLRPSDRARLSRIATVAPATMDLPDVSVRTTELRAGRDHRELVVCVGRLIASKRFDRALTHVASRRKTVTEVVVVGDGPERGRLEAQARALGLDARFVGRTSREEALAWMGAADALLHASQTEGLSTVVREAEALGVRVEIVA